MQVQLSAVIITFNEEKNIERCIVSAKKVADEILVVDSFSTDRTVSICESMGVRVVQNKWEGYTAQKNYAQSLVSNDYILSLDADEALSDQLLESVLAVKKEGLNGVYEFNRLTNYCGTWIRHTSWYPDKKIRIFNRHTTQWVGEIHEQLDFKTDSIYFLEGDLLHFSFYTIEQHLLQIEKFSTAAANELYGKGKRTNVLLIGLKVISRFIKNYIIRFGFLDGKAGFNVSRFSAYANYLKYKKLLHLQKQLK